MSCTASIMEAEIDDELEDGEIDDDEAEVDEIYVPLERPETSAPPPTSLDIQELSDREDPSSSSDSDDSQRGRIRLKQMKKSLHQRPSTAMAPKKKNYNIWCTDVTEEALTTTLNNCSVDQTFDRSRDVESYNHLLAVPHLKEVEKVLRESLPVSLRLGNRKGSNKRHHGGTFVDVKRKGFKGHMNAKKPSLQGSREIPPLSKTAEDLPEDLAQDIANKLFEEKEDIILQAINVLGKEAAIGIFEETRGIEKSGGLLIMNGERRRTPGGVYFYLLKCSGRLKPEQISLIFGDARKAFNATKRKTAKEARLARAAERKAALKAEDYRTLLSKAEAAIFKMKNKEEHEPEDGGVKNPPPSPATDGKDNSSDGEEPKLQDVDM